MRIAMIGSRGIPATYGGVEHHVEEIAAGLVARGHDVTVFCRTNYTQDRPETYRGVKLAYLPTVSSKSLDAIVHSFLSTVAAIAGRYDIIHYHALGPGIPSALARLTPSRIVQTIHGMDNQRAKWGGLAKRILDTAAYLSATVPDEVIVVARGLVDTYASLYHRRVTYVPNGHPDVTAAPADEITSHMGLTGQDYVLFLGRLVPEKAPDMLIDAFRQLDTNQKLVIAGGSSFTDDFVAGLKAMADGDPRIIFPGYVYGRQLAELYSNATAFVLPSHLEGLPLTLLEALAYRTPVIASDIPPHREVLSQSGPGHRLFRAGDSSALRDALADVLADPASERTGVMAAAPVILQDYQWDSVVAGTESVYFEARVGRRGRRARAYAR